MKKFLFIALLSTLILSASSCKKDKDETSSLIGTSWVATGVDYYDGHSYSWTETLNFTTASTGTLIYTDTDNDNDMESFTYTYNHPILTIIWDEDDYDITTINGNTMILWGDTFHKK